MSESSLEEIWIEEAKIYIPKLSCEQLKNLVENILSVTKLSASDGALQYKVKILDLLSNQEALERAKVDENDAPTIEAGAVQSQQKQIALLKNKLIQLEVNRLSLSTNISTIDMLKSKIKEAEKKLNDLNTTEENQKEDIMGLTNQLTNAQRGYDLAHASRAAPRITALNTSIQNLQNLEMNVDTEEERNTLALRQLELTNAQRGYDLAHASRAAPRITALNTAIQNLQDQEMNVDTEEERNTLAQRKLALSSVQQQLDAAISVTDRIQALDNRILTVRNSEMGLRPTQEQQAAIEERQRQLTAAQKRYDIAIAIGAVPRIAGLDASLGIAQDNINQIGVPQIPPLGYWERNVLMIGSLIVALCIVLSSACSIVFGLKVSHRYDHLNMWLYFASAAASCLPSIGAIWLGNRAGRYAWRKSVFPCNWWGADWKAIADGLALWAGIVAVLGRVVQVVIVMRKIHKYFILDLSCLDTFAKVVPIVREMLQHN